jgi:tRNA threonylcarbamoyladenosine biosynthesis protein TsaE
VVDTRRKTRSAAARDAAGPRRPAGPTTVFSLSETETYEMGRAFARRLDRGDLVLLEGDLGLGKTVFVRGVADGLGIPPEDVSSPSFTLVQEYRGGRLTLFHVDLYRVDVPEDVGSLGIEEILTAGGVVVVEWGDKLPPYLRREAVTVRFHDVGEGSRRIEVVADPRTPRKRTGDA